MNDGCKLFWRWSTSNILSFYKQWDFRTVLIKHNANNQFDVVDIIMNRRIAQNRCNLDSFADQFVITAFQRIWIWVQFKPSSNLLVKQCCIITPVVDMSRDFWRKKKTFQIFLITQPKVNSLFLKYRRKDLMSPSALWSVFPNSCIWPWLKYVAYIEVKKAEPWFGNRNPFVIRQLSDYLWRERRNAQHEAWKFHNANQKTFFIYELGDSL